MLDGRNVLVVGMGRSGVSAARYALNQGAFVTVTDGRTDAPTVDGATHRYGALDEADFAAAELIVVSPGVPAATPVIARAIARGTPVVSELAFAAERLQERRIPIIAITGTNGKSSVAWFTSQLIEAAGHSAFLGGNFGTPLTDLLDAHPPPDFAVVEVSSYQLELPGNLAPTVAACLNLARDHLGRHGTMDRYAEHKLRLFHRMPPTGHAAIPRGPEANPDGRLTHEGTRATPLWIGAHPGIAGTDATLSLSGTPDDGPVDLSAMTLLGDHNRDNASAAILLAVAAGVAREAIDVGCLTALPHRLEPVHTTAGVTWVNDSKATNIDAALVGIRGIARPKIVLLGGAGKAGSDYTRLQAVLDRSIRSVICFGDAGPQIADAIGRANVTCVSTLSDAVHAAARAAMPDDVVLLSPACASFDEFTNFEERGRAFTALAKEATP